MTVLYLLVRCINWLINLYSAILFVYVLLTWFPVRRWELLSKLFDFLGMLCEPLLGIFRRWIPPVGGLDFTPIVAIIAVELVGKILIKVLYLLMGLF